MNISDERLAELLATCSESREYHRIRSNRGSQRKYEDLMIALALFQSLRSLDRKLTAMLTAEADREIELFLCGGKFFEAILYEHNYDRYREAIADTPFAALEKLAGEGA